MWAGRCWRESAVAVAGALEKWAGRQSPEGWWWGAAWWYWWERLVWWGKPDADWRAQCWAGLGRGGGSATSLTLYLNSAVAAEDGLPHWRMMHLENK